MDNKVGFIVEVKGYNAEYSDSGFLKENMFAFGIKFPFKAKVVVDDLYGRVDCFIIPIQLTYPIFIEGRFFTIKINGIQLGKLLLLSFGKFKTKTIVKVMAGINILVESDKEVERVESYVPFIGDYVYLKDNSYIHPLNNYGYNPLLSCNHIARTVFDRGKLLRVVSNPYMLTVYNKMFDQYVSKEFITVDCEGVLFRVLNKVF